VLAVEIIVRNVLGVHKWEGDDLREKYGDRCLYWRCAGCGATMVYDVSRLAYDDSLLSLCPDDVLDRELYR